MGGEMRNVWGILWRSKNKLFGKAEHLIWKFGKPILYPSRKEAREYIELEYGYIRTRPDLRAEPHGWKMPIPVKVKIEVCK
ncbi:MAG: hypothetical protein H7831_18475 [Magnetococcus sp. WYHC-3]